MNIESYFAHIKQLVEQSAYVRSYDIQFDKRSDYIGFIRGVLYFGNQIELHFREFTDTRTGQKYKYAYHFMQQTHLIFRYDNSDAVQSREFTTHPHHKHLQNGTVTDANEPSLDQILTEVSDFIENLS